MTSSALFGGAELPVVGQLITAITLDSNVVIYAGRHREHEFRIENSFSIKNRQRETSFEVRFDPYNRDDPVSENLTELAAIIDSVIIGARAYVSGVLELSFDDGFLIVVQPLDCYEAWCYTFENYILACPPGGFRSA